MMKRFKRTILLVTMWVVWAGMLAQGQSALKDIHFVRQGVRRHVFDANHTIPLAALNPNEIIGITAMFPTTHYLETHAQVDVRDDKLMIWSDAETQTGIWFGGFNPFATYTIDLNSCVGDGAIGFEFSDPAKAEQYRITVAFKDNRITDVRQHGLKDQQVVLNESIAINTESENVLQGKLILQMLGSGLTLYRQSEGLPLPIGQADFSQYIDLRNRSYLHTFQSAMYLDLKKGAVKINRVTSALSSGMGQADIRAMTYEDGTPILDQGRLWYTMTIRGRALPHHVQGVFSMDPTAFDVRFEGVIVFDRQDGILRNEVASHIFYDRKDEVWRGITTGFSAYANPQEKKELLAVESVKDPRFGFSVMQASPFGIVGDIEDPHILYDTEAGKWRILTCENIGGYKAIMLESDTWNKGYRRIAGPVAHNSTGTSIQRIGGKLYCLSGSDQREIFIYSYPDLKEAGTLRMDLPPWDDQSGTRVWPNVVELPEGYPFRYVALMMDRFNYPGISGPNWTYGALYLYHGYQAP